MKDEKKFDCVDLKNWIQADILDERQRIGEAEQEKRNRDWLRSSDDPLACWWRDVTGTRKSSP